MLAGEAGREEGREEGFLDGDAGDATLPGDAALPGEAGRLDDAGRGDDEREESLTDVAEGDEGFDVLPISPLPGDAMVGVGFARKETDFPPLPFVPVLRTGCILLTPLRVGVVAPLPIVWVRDDKVVDLLFVGEDDDDDAEAEEDDEEVFETTVDCLTSLFGGILVMLFGISIKQKQLSADEDSFGGGYKYIALSSLCGSGGNSALLLASSAAASASACACAAAAAAASCSAFVIFCGGFVVVVGLVPGLTFSAVCSGVGGST